MPAPVGRLDRDDDMVVVMGLGLLGSTIVAWMLSYFSMAYALVMIKNWIEFVAESFARAERSRVSCLWWIDCVQKTDPP